MLPTTRVNGLIAAAALVTAAFILLMSFHTSGHNSSQEPDSNAEGINLSTRSLRSIPSPPDPPASRPPASTSKTPFDAPIDTPHKYIPWDKPWGRFAEWELWHFVWTPPKQGEQGYDRTKQRTVDFSHLTGCCDRSLALAISSVLAAYPQSRVWLWSDAKDWSQAIIHQRILDTPRLTFKYFDGASEAQDFPNIVSFYQSTEHWAHRSIVWADITRYVILRNYGGSYLDADTALIRPLNETLQMNNIDPSEDKALVDMCCSHKPGTALNLMPCGALLLTPNGQKPGEHCALSNGVLLNFPQGHWVFQETLERINKERIIGSFFNAFGPNYISHVAGDGYRAGRQLVPRLFNFLFWTGPGAVKGKYQPSFFGNTRTTKAGSLHTELDEGDMVDGSLCHFVLCTNLYNIGVALPGSCSVFDKFPQEHWTKKPPTQAIASASAPAPASASAASSSASSASGAPVQSLRPWTGAWGDYAEWELWHFVWTVPKQGEKGYDRNKERTVDGNHVTGCCDRSLALAISAVLAQYPHAQAWLWSDADWTNEFVRQHILDTPRLLFKRFDGAREAKDFPNIADFYVSKRDWTHRSIIWADLTRYLIIRNYGGSYLDADTALLRPIDETLKMNNLGIGEARALMDFCCTAPQKDLMPCEQLYLTRKGTEKPGEQCIASNGVILNFPKGHWLFTYALDSINKQTIVGRFFNDFGPHFLSRFIRQGYDTGEPLVPRLLTFLLWTGDGAVKGEYRPTYYGNALSAKAGSLHTELDGGDLVDGSLCHFMLCTNSYKIGVPLPRSCGVFDKYPQEHWARDSKGRVPTTKASTTQQQGKTSGAAQAHPLLPWEGSWGAFKEWDLWHFVWTIPKDGEKGYDRVRKVDTSSLTGCCDRSVGLAIASVLSIYPHAQVWLWSDSTVWTNEIVRKHILDTPRLHYKHFDGGLEARDFPKIAAFYRSDATWAHRSIVWSDITRYVIMRNYGGSYLDADTSLLRPVVETLGRQGVPASEARALMDLSNTVPTGTGDTIPCDALLLTKGIRNAGTYCIGANGVLLNFPRKHWLFTDVLQSIDSDSRGVANRFFNDFGPQYLSSFIRKGYDLEKPLVPRLLNFLFWTGLGAVKGEYQPPYYGNALSTHAGSLHTELDDGDFVDGSLCHFIYCYHSYQVRIALPDSCSRFDQYTQEHWLTPKARPAKEVVPYNPRPWPTSFGPFGEWGLWHFVWTLPKAGERGYNDNRTTDFSHLTGCCDRSVGLAIASVLAVYPHAQVWLWTDSKVWTDEIVRARILNTPRLHVKYFDGEVEARDFPRVAAFYKSNATWPYRSIIWSDITRYVILRNYGGSYLDADTSLIRPLKETLQMYGVSPDEDKALIDLCCLAKVPTEIGKLPPCDTLLLSAANGRREQPGLGCIGSNGVLLNFPERHWMFEYTLEALSRQERLVGRFFNDFGPYFMSYNVRAGYNTNEPLVPRFIHFLNWASSAVKAPFKVSQYKSALSNPRGCLHTELDEGDMKDGTLAHFLLCKHKKTLGITPVDESCSQFDSVNLS